MDDDFCHRLAIDTIRSGDRVDLVADETERAAIAKRFGILELHRLQAHATLERDGKRIRAEGRLQASLSQSCVATGDPVHSHVDEAFEIHFVPEPAAGAEEIELGADDVDSVIYDGSAIDLGTAIADTLALSINPYPRSAGADAALKEAGVLDEEQAGPFAILAKLRKGESGA
jgi:uncharacterized metal-binding protein YceD (DUF177 family)